MPFREKARSFFKSSKSKSDPDSLSKASTKDSSRERWPSNVYKPGETMPRPKYRATPKKEHTEKLQAFSFTDAWRKRSFQSQHSPMGTRLPSRRNSSRVPSRKNSIFSIGRRSMSDAGRTNSVTSVDTGPSSTRPGGSRKKSQNASHAAKPTPLETEPEEEDEDGVNDVRHPSPGPKQVVPKRRSAGDRSSGTAHDHHPFTEQELALAIQRSHLAVPAN